MSDYDDDDDGDAFPYHAAVEGAEATDLGQAARIDDEDHRETALFRVARSPGYRCKLHNTDPVGCMHAHNITEVVDRLLGSTATLLLGAEGVGDRLEVFARSLTLWPAYVNSAYTNRSPGARMITAARMPSPEAARQRPAVQYSRLTEDIGELWSPVYGTMWLFMLHDLTDQFPTLLHDLNLAVEEWTAIPMKGRGGRSDYYVYDRTTYE